MWSWTDRDKTFSETTDPEPVRSVDWAMGKSVCHGIPKGVNCEPDGLYIGEMVFQSLNLNKKAHCQKRKHHYYQWYMGPCDRFYFGVQEL